MNILVTGGAGFIGSNIVDAYLEAGHTVVIVDDLSTGKIENVNPKAKFHNIDLRDPAVETVFKEMKIDVINHHAAQMDVRKSVADPKFDASVNILGMLNVFELGVKVRSEEGHFFVDRRSHLRRAGLFPGRRAASSPAVVAVRRDKARNGKISFLL